MRQTRRVHVRAMGAPARPASWPYNTRCPPSQTQATATPPRGVGPAYTTQCMRERLLEAPARMPVTQWVLRLLSMVPITRAVRRRIRMPATASRMRLYRCNYRLRTRCHAPGSVLHLASVYPILLVARSMARSAHTLPRREQHSAIRS